jgi:hypothetical protein
MRMTLVLNLPPEIEARITGEASRQGISESELVVQVLEDRFPSDPVPKTPREAVDTWEKEGILGSWGDGRFDSPELVRRLRTEGMLRIWDEK